MAQNKSIIPSGADLVELKKEAESLAARIPTEKRMHLSELMKEVNTVYPEFSDHNLRYLLKINLLPQRKEPGRNYHYFVRDDLRDIFLILALRDDTRQWRISSYSQIAGLLNSIIRREREAALKTSDTIEVGVTQDQRQRGLYFWRGNLMRYFLLNLFNGTAPPSALVFLFRPRKRISETLQAGLSPWLTIKTCNYGDVAYRLGKHDLVLATLESGEVFHLQVDRETIEKYRKGLWYTIEGGGDRNPVDYEIVIATPAHAQDRSALDDPSRASVQDRASLIGHAGEDLSTLDDPTHTTILLRLIDGCFLDVSDLAAEANRAITTMDVVTHLVAKMSPSWQYCASLASSDKSTDRLEVRSFSSQFPSDSRRTAQIGVGQLLSGRAFAEGYPVVVQHAIGEDPRITDDAATAAAAVPSLFNGRPNGALYVATRKQTSVDNPFSDADIGSLRIFGLLVGQLLAQEEALQRSGQSSLVLVADHKPQVREWTSLEQDLSVLLTELRPPDRTNTSQDSFQLVAIQVRNYAHFTPLIADWAVQQLQYSAVRYFDGQGDGKPNIYVRNCSDFLLLLPRVKSSDEYEQRVRRELRKRLNSLALSIPGETRTTIIETDLWSLPFRYATLLVDNRAALEQQVSSIITTTEQTFEILPHIRQAHDYERQGSWIKALEHYRLAYRLAPGNSYLMRHIAKALTQLQQHDDAILWWHKALSAQEHPSHYRRLAHNLIAQGKKESYQLALDEIDKAIALDARDPKSHALAGDVHFLCEEYELAIVALETAAALDTGSVAPYHLRIAEAHFAMGEYVKALDSCQMAQTYEPDNRDIRFLMMKFAREMNRVSSHPRN